MIRWIANAVLTVAAIFGALSFCVWLATANGLIQPLVVVSGSMRPVYEIGDLLITAPRPVGEVSPGAIVTVPSPDQSNVLVTHRVVSVSAIDDRTATFVLKGDDNAEADPAPYVISGTVLVPVLHVPGLGAVVEQLRSPWTAIPLTIGLFACLGITLLRTDDRRSPRRAVRTDADRPTTPESN
ncbi:MAG TPA: signal peptidase I [Propionicimonas sp.]|nr:signal peptidase I [Propionicimonas sp.]